MSAICDNKSVGVIIKNELDEVLLIERKKKPFGFAGPAGHIDDFPSSEACAIGEVKEEVGLDAHSLQLLFEDRYENECRREGGNFHHWYVFSAEVDGVLALSDDEVKQALWVDKTRLKKLCARTESYITGDVSEEEWQRNPGLEPVWVDIFKRVQLI